jgi:hypothetical protein
VRLVPFSCFAHSESFSTVSRASCPVFMFGAPGLIFGGAECGGSRFHVLRARNHFRWCRGRRVPISCVALPDSFSTVSRASGPFFMFCAPILVFDVIEGVGSRFHVLCSWTRFQRCRVRRVPFSCFVLPDSFSAVLRASGPVFLFCAPRLVFDGTEGVGSRFHVLCSQTRFRRCRMHRVPFSAVSRASGPIFMFCAPELIFCCIEGVGSRFHVLCSRTRFLFGGAGGVESRFHILPVRTHFRRYRGLLDLLTCFAP